MLTFPKYENYRDSGVEWLGEIPSHWKVLPLTKYVKSAVDYRGKTPTKVESGIFLVTARNIKDGVIDYEISKEYVAEREYDGIMSRGKPRVDDLLFTTEAPLGGVALVDREDIALAQRIIKFRLNEAFLLPQFARYSMLSPYFQEYLATEATGSTAQGIKASKLHKLKIIAPFLYEQKRIVEFLDRTTTDIDRAISQKQRLIELLQEQKAILINQAVTKGLNPNVPMRDSGIEWLGEIPEDWNTKKLKYVSKIFRGKFTHRPRNDPRLYDGEYPFIQTGDVAKSGKFLTEYKQTLNEKGLRVSTLIPKETVVITIAANIGDISILGIDACFPDSVVGFQPKADLDRDFLYYVLLSMKQQFINTATKNTQMNLNVDRIGSNFVPLPDLAEQQKIVEWIEDQIFDTVKAETSFLQSIELLDEYRSIVIANTVTGKIKV